jgi:hypothetical protein
MHEEVELYQADRTTWVGPVVNNLVIDLAKNTEPQHQGIDDNVPPGLVCGKQCRFTRMVRRHCGLLEQGSLLFVLCHRNCCVYSLDTVTPMCS